MVELDDPYFGIPMTLHRESVTELLCTSSTVHDIIPLYTGKFVENFFNQLIVSLFFYETSYISDSKSI